MSIILNVINYFWKLGYSEESPDIFVKEYDDSLFITIDMINELMDYGGEIDVADKSLTEFSQRNFVILESVDRFLINHQNPSNIKIFKNSLYDYVVESDLGSIRLAIKCTIWEDEYDHIIKSIDSKFDLLSSFFDDNLGAKFVIYSSRLKAGLIECKYSIISKDSFHSDKDNIFETKNKGLFLNDGQNSSNHGAKLIEGVNDYDLDDFEIEFDKLIRYTGTKSNVVVPSGIKKIMNGAFWNCIHLETVEIPDGVVSLGGDTFFDCVNLKNLKIPGTVEIIGDNPFANCPKLNLINESPKFILKDGALYNKDKTRLIYYSINDCSNVFRIPDGIISIGKHAFYNCNKLEKIIIPPSVKIIENNPFTNCHLLTLENNSPNFILDDGALYNKTMTTLFYYQINSKSKYYEIPDGVNIIGRHSFYNCNNLEKLKIPQSVKIIGYNPFTNCPMLSLINQSSNYLYENGVLYNKEKTELIYYSLSNLETTFSVPNSIKKIGRNAFFGAKNLRNILIPHGVSVIERSAFANCTNIFEVNIPESTVSIGEWAFYNCISLLELTIPENTSIESHTFEKCSNNLKIIKRQVSIN